MDLKHFTYAGLLLGTLAIPLALSFDKKVHFWTKWKYLFPAILIAAILFIYWDIQFTTAGIWSFNHDYVLGYFYKGLPLEEWLFFLIVPYACLFIYEVLKAYFQTYEFPRVFAAVSLGLIVLFGLLSFYHQNQLYTFFNFLFAAVYLSYTIFRNRFKQHLSKFYFTYLITLLPFLLINGVLTAIPVVQYSSDHILNIRVLTIPVEDFGYLFLLLLMNTTIYETLKEQKYY
ncbi:lycopene cyclase domain-containing protein [Sunxiuqinia sp. sy24]|uniref:lycopene cyclase domain-containing protein n=1 Tax=Sunxiuqinia sp. sy24 TaxID=3461495 RepID=UPI0040467988